ncbi:tripartite tricarboxylate transporter TctB family protein [Elioraea rosea]|uniref:tripartite tricarboxylate transporter TctB family protein n=1 Tax=Elioraea rosea TaxID=2492390 RepID=UPI001183AE0B|nr:tripartite tricarboxylate transporter TctB family protein [Elioraea rosea]
MPRKGMTDRVLGVALAALGLAAILGAAAIEVPFLGDPVGPKPFPIAAGAVLVACGLLIAARPGEPVEWPSAARLGAIAAATAALVLFAVGMRPLGFVLATAVTVAVAAAVFGARIVHAVMLGLGTGFALFWLFDRVLEIPLPLGLLAPLLR